jgi:hypothetical protein
VFFSTRKILKFLVIKFLDLDWHRSKSWIQISIETNEAPHHWLYFYTTASNIRWVEGVRCKHTDLSPSMVETKVLGSQQWCGSGFKADPDPAFYLNAGEWKTPASHFDWAKPSQKSLSRCKWFMLLSWNFIIKKLKKLAGPPVYYTGSNVSCHAPKIRVAGQYL